MIIWSGYGVLTVLIAVGGFLLSAALQPLIAGFASGGIATAIGFAVAAAVNWLVGVRLNRRPGRILVDPKTGQTVVLRRRHALFWIPMQYWSVLFLAFALSGLLLPGQVQVPAIQNKA